MLLDCKNIGRIMQNISKFQEGHHARMQGYILKIIPTKTQDLIVKILTPQSLRSFYRFYGARHSTIGLGYKIDFEEHPNAHFLPQVRHILHLSFGWECEWERVYVWQRFLGLLELHLDEVYEVGEFYFNLLEQNAKKIAKQNPLRVFLESYARLLEYEGRLGRQEENRCFVCDRLLESHITLGRAFLFAHPQCVHGFVFNKSQVLEFFAHASTLHLEDIEVQKLWQILCLGL